MTHPTDDGPALKPSKITFEEFVELFGGEIPMEAIDLVWNSPGKMTIAEVRAKLNEMAERRKGPALKPCKCGGEAELEQSGVFDRIVCHSCGTATDWVNDYTDAVIESWNAKRTPKDEATADIAAGRKLDDAINKSEVEFMRGLKPSDEARRLVEAVISSAFREGQAFEHNDAQRITPIVRDAKAALLAHLARLEAAREAKPVVWRWHRHFKGLWHYDEEKPEFSDPTIVPQPLYTAPPHADLVAENARLREALETAARRLDHADFCMSAQEARAALTNGGKNARTDAGEAGE